MMNAKIGFTALFCLAMVAADSQTWAHFSAIGGGGEESFFKLKTGPNHSAFVSGAYTQPFEWNGIETNPVGNGDVFLARLDAEGAPLWILAGGSADADNAQGLAPRSDGGAFWGGAFWDSIDLGGWIGAPPLGGKAIFLLSVSPSGTPEWGKSFYGAGVKEIRDLLVDDDGNLYAVGYFGGQLMVDDTLLQAHGDLDGFVAQWNSAGDLQWARRFGEDGNVWGECLAFREPAALFLGGRFNGAMELAVTAIQSNTFDDDGFVAALAADTGEALWLRKAGAQYDDAVTGLAVNEAGDLFAAGSFVGVLQVAPDWQITTAGFNTNFFLIRYRALDGTPEWAQSLGNLTDEQCLGLSIRNEGPVVAGLFRGALTLNGQSVSAMGAGFNGFVAGFHPNGAPRWLAGIPGDGLVVPETVAVDEDGAVWVAGGFTQTIFFDGNPVAANGAFDAWLGKLNEMVTPALETKRPEFSGKIFPNPVSDILYLEDFPRPYSFRLFRSDGALLQEGAGAGSIDFQQLPGGVYFVCLFSNEEMRTIMVTKK